MTLILSLLLSFAVPTAHADAKPNATVKGAKMSKAQQRKQSKANAREMELLQRSAELYWEGVRWNDTEKSANFIENSAARLEFQAWLDTENADHKLIDVKIIGVSVQSIDDKDSPFSRTAIIKVASEGYTMPEQVLKKTIKAQEWYRTSTGWWLRWTPPELTPTP